VFLTSQFILAQGCSDAGLCTIGDLKSGGGNDSAKSKITLAETFGLADPIALIQITQLEFQHNLTPSTSLFLKIPFQVSYGDLGIIGGTGDFTTSVSQVVYKRSDKKLLLMAGTVIPTNNSDLKIGNRTLPMQYQSSLGTYDLILGSIYSYKKWRFMIGYQHPFNSNDNGFLFSKWKDNKNAQNTAYFESNNFNRGDDFIIRIERKFKLKSSTIFVSALPIQRLQKDEITKNGEIIKLKGSDELTLNLNFMWVKPISKKLAFTFVYGSPIIWRKTRADGLTRPVVITTSLSWKY